MSALKSNRTRPVAGGSIWDSIQRFATGMWIGRALLVLGIGIGWQLLADRGAINPFFFGTPLGVLRFFFDMLFVSRSLLLDLAWTTAGVVLSFAIGSLAGIATGLLFATYPIVGRFLDPFIVGFNVLPRIALAPLFILWFGLGLESKVAVGISLTFFIVLSTTVAGVRSVNPDHITLARVLNASSSQTFFRITLPSAVPIIFSGLRLGLIYALLGVVGGEFIGAQHGLGIRIQYLANTFETNGVFAVLLLLAIVGGALTGLMSRLEDWLVRWR